MLKKYILFACCCLVLMACEKEDDATKNEQAKELITGFVIIDPDNNPIQDIGEPNEQHFTGGSVAVSSYPNPTMNVITVSLSSSTPSKMSVWLTFAQLDQSLKTTTYYMPPAGTPGTVAQEFAADMDVAGNVSFDVNITALPPGPYRLYFKMGQELAWRNVIIKRQ